MSLFSAGPELVGDVVVSYGDIVYHPDVLTAVLDNNSPGALAVDTAWEATYAGRTDHPVDQAELCRVSPHGFVSRVGKYIPAGRGVLGEFIGLARFRSSLVAHPWALYLDALDKGDHLLRECADIAQGVLDGHHQRRCGRWGVDRGSAHRGRWREIDTVQDLERAKESSPGNGRSPMQRLSSYLMGAWCAETTRARSTTPPRSSWWPVRPRQGWTSARP